MSDGKISSLSTLSLHADDLHHHNERDVAPRISVSTTFRHPHPEFLDDLKEKGELKDWDPANPEGVHIYSRYTQQVSTRAETVLSKISGGHAIVFASGLAASYAALIHFKPKRIAIREGYHGVHNAIEVYKRIKTDLEVVDLNADVGEGDLVWVETPLNPTGEARDLRVYEKKAHDAGAKLIVDATFAPPPVSDPFKWGADLVLHSGSKYFGGHSDVLAGVLIAKTVAEWRELWHIRTFTGANLGSLEAWLLLRSLRTYSLRVNQQFATGTALATWLSRIAESGEKGFDGVPGGVVDAVWHAALQKEPWVREQVNKGPACFGLRLAKEEHARILPHSLQYFTPATSLGGVETLIEQRCVSDPGADPRVIRISVGLEDIEDLKDDLRQALNKIAQT